MDWLTADVAQQIAVTFVVTWVCCWICGGVLFFLISEDAPAVRARMRQWWRTKRQQRRSEFSPTWTRQQQQQESRVEYHGPKITWPIRPKEQ